MIFFLSGLFSAVFGGMGIGGGMLLIPVLTFFTDLTQQQIQGINLMYFIPSAAAAVIIHKKKGNIGKSVLKPVILPSLPACAIGAFAAMAISAGSLRRLFAIFLLFVGISELFKKGKGK